MLARCAGKDDTNKYFAMVDTLFRQQRHLGGRKADPAAAGDRQAGRLHRADFQRLPGESEAPRRHRKACVSAPSTSSRCKSTPTFFINGEQVTGRRDDRGNGQGDRPLSQGRIRVFRLGVGARRRPPISAPRGPKGLENRRYRAAPLLLQRARQFILRRCGTCRQPVGAKPPDRIYDSANRTTLRMIEPVPFTCANIEA